MSLGEIGWIIFLAGLPFSQFLKVFVPINLDIWHCQAAWSQAWIAILMCMGLANGTQRTFGNKVLAYWFSWISLWTLWSFSVGASRKEYPLDLTVAWVHCLLLVIFYQLAIQSWNKEFLVKLIRCIAISGVIVMGYSLLQLAGLDQFFLDLDKKNNSSLVGTIGNPSHYSAYLSMLFPLLMIQKGKQWWIARVACIGLLIRTVVVERCFGGITGLLCGITFLAWFTDKRLFILLIVLMLSGIVWIVWTKHFPSNSGRFQVWKLFYEWLKKIPETGLGVGFIRTASTQITSGTLFQWRHVHNEYLQIAIEQGIIGLSLALWMVFDLAKKFYHSTKSNLSIVLAATGIVFLFNSLLNYPAHLWLLGSFGLISFCGIYVLANEELA